MEQNLNHSKDLLRLAGISGLMVGISIISFAILSSRYNIFFIEDIYGESKVEEWIQNVIHHPDFVSFIMILPVLGFSFILVAAMAFYNLIESKSWQKNLALASYFIGSTVVLTTMIFHHTFMNHIVQEASSGINMTDSFLDFARFEISFWMDVNSYVGPLFVVVFGTGIMSWALLKEYLLPKWLCYWAFIVSILLLLSFLAPIFPSVSVLGNAAPLHMVWFIVAGIYLLKKSYN
jgi:hypothetical protein